MVELPYGRAPYRLDLTGRHATVVASPHVAFRAGAALARAWFTVRSPRAPSVLASETGPLPVVSEAVFRIGVLPRLAPGVSIRLVSSLSPSKVASTLVDHAASLESVLAKRTGRVVVIPQASQLILEASS